MLGWEDYKCNIKGLRFFNVYGEHEEHKGDQNECISQIYTTSN